MSDKFMILRERRTPIFPLHREWVFFLFFFCFFLFFFWSS